MLDHDHENMNSHSFFGVIWQCCSVFDHINSNSNLETHLSLIYNCLCWHSWIIQSYYIKLWLFAFTPVQLPLKARLSFHSHCLPGKSSSFFGGQPVGCLGMGSHSGRPKLMAAVFGECFSKAFSLKWDSIWAMEKHWWFIGYYYRRFFF